MITATNVSKRFDSILAVDCVSTVISQGAVFGLIGSNGAGKSTFLRLLAGVLKANSRWTGSRSTNLPTPSGAAFSSATSSISSKMPRPRP